MNSSIQTKMNDIVLQHVGRMMRYLTTINIEMINETTDIHIAPPAMGTGKATEWNSLSRFKLLSAVMAHQWPAAVMMMH